MHARERGSGYTSPSTAQLSCFGVSRLTEEVWCHINVATFLEPSFPEGRERNKENKPFVNEKFGAFHYNPYLQLAHSGAPIMQSWSSFTGSILDAGWELESHIHPSINSSYIHSSSIPLSIYLSIYYLVIHSSIYPASAHCSGNLAFIHSSFIIPIIHSSILQLFVYSFIFNYFLLSFIHLPNQPTNQPTFIEHLLWAFVHHFPIFMVK